MEREDGKGGTGIATRNNDLETKDALPANGTGSRCRDDRPSVIKY